MQKEYVKRLHNLWRVMVAMVTELKLKHCSIGHFLKIWALFCQTKCGKGLNNQLFEQIWAGRNKKTSALLWTTARPIRFPSTVVCWAFLADCSGLLFRVLEDEREEDWGHFFIFEKSVENVEIIFWKWINKKYDFRFFVFSTLLFLCLTLFAIKTFSTYSYVQKVQIKILIKLFTLKCFKFVFLLSNGVGHVFLKMKPTTKELPARRLSLLPAPTTTTTMTTTTTTSKQHNNSTTQQSTT